MMVIFEKKKTIIALSGLWIILGIISGIQVYFFQAFNEQKPVFVNIILFESAKYFLWIINIPVILFLFEKFPFVAGKPITWPVILHVSACLILGFFHMIIFEIYLGITGLVSIADIFAAFFKIIQLLSFNHIFSYTALLSIIAAIEYYNKYVEKESLSLKLEKLYSDARLASLKMQLHPHFLFNVLNNVAMLIRQNKNSEAVSMISLLSVILRHILDNKEKKLISLKEEFDLAQKYLAIESFRFADRLNYKIEIENGINEILVPDLILQPIIENAFKHGLADKETDCNILITAKDLGASISISVEDNGCGRANKKDFFNGGNGLSITIERLKQTYGDKTRFNIDSEAGLFTKISFVIPKQ